MSGPGARAHAAWMLVVSVVACASAAEAASARQVGGGIDHTCVLTRVGGVQCWGTNTWGQLGDGTTTSRSTPADVFGLSSGVIDVGVGGWYFACALTTTGGVKCWGDNVYGELGDGTTATYRTIPTDVSGLTSGVAAISVGREHACALTTAGGVKCWGNGALGRLGNGTTASSNTPVDVSGLMTGAAAVTAAGRHACAITITGSVRCWGYNSNGQLGDGTNTNSSTPVSVGGLGSGVMAVAGGSYSTCALTNAGGVQCWGRNTDGQLGDGTTSDRWTPTNVSGLTGGVAAIGVAFSHACAVLSTGALKCWGGNANGEVGDGTTTTPRTMPTDVSGLGSGVAVPGVGGSHTCAVLSDGAVKCWGYNAGGQLGDGTTTSRPTAGDVVGMAGGESVAIQGAYRVTTGGYHACALRHSSDVVCWGANANGQLGDGSSADRNTPVRALGLNDGVMAVSAGTYHTCALTSARGLKCWGKNDKGQLGDGSATDRWTPTDVSGLTSGVAEVSAGWYHTCAITTVGGLKCWGDNTYGQLGDGTTTARLTPVAVAGLSSGVAGVSVGDEHTCVVTTTGGVKCWGLNASGQLGNGTTTNAKTAAWVSGLGSGVAQVSCGGFHTCARLSSGAVRCWGNNDSGQVGDGTTTARTTPSIIVGVTGSAAEVSAGYYHTCAVTSEGRVQCWGDNLHGQLGDGTTSGRATAVTVDGLRTGGLWVDAGWNTTCAAVGQSGVQCWGRNSDGQLGDGSTFTRETPVWTTGLVSGQAALSSGSSLSCRATAAGGVQCWGLNDHQQVGDGTTTLRRTPVDVVGLASGVVAVAASDGFACALGSGGDAQCWGDNSFGQLGDGTLTSRGTAAEVVGRTGGTVVIATGLHFACAVTASGGVQCWGGNDFGQLGDATTTNRTTPVWVTGLTRGVVAVAAGWFHACALTAAGAVRCWGYNTYGQLGDGSSISSTVPVGVVDMRSGVSAVAAGGYHTCGLTTMGGLKCWGGNSQGQVGNGTTTDQHTAVGVSGLTSGVMTVQAGGWHTCAVSRDGEAFCWGDNYSGQLGDGTRSDRATPTTVSGGLISGAGVVSPGFGHTCATMAAGGLKCWGDGTSGVLGNGTLADRATPIAVRGFKLDDDFDADVKADVAVYRPSAGTWFSLNSSMGNASYQSRGWGVDAQGDVPAPGDFDGDGVVDPTVFRASTGSWFILQSGSSYTTWTYFGWGTTGDTPVPADYDGDGITDGAVYRPSTGTWYVRPSAGGTQWSVGFGNSTDVPVPGHWDSDGMADIAVYRPSTGTWFVLPSSTGYASYWYKGWGVNAQGDTPAPGDYDGDGRLDLCVFRPTTGTWFLLESQTNFTWWRYFGWGANGDTVVPSDYDGDGVTDAAVYRPSNYTWYIRPSSGAAQWSVVFGQAGDQVLIAIR